jgi:hypothetical protein
MLGDLEESERHSCTRGPGTNSRRSHDSVRPNGIHGPNALPICGRRVPIRKGVSGIHRLSASLFASPTAARLLEQVVVP